MGFYLQDHTDFFLPVNSFVNWLPLYIYISLNGTDILIIQYVLPFSRANGELLEFVSFQTGVHTDLKFPLEYDLQRVFFF